MQIVLFLALILSVLILIMSKSDSLSKEVKIYAGISVAILLGAMYFYESMQFKEETYNRNIVNAYMQGKTLTCNNYKVNKNSFIYVSGTSTFIAKKDQKDLQGIMLEASTCNIGK